jgi:trk system potassium uptake protein TrkH
MNFRLIIRILGFLIIFLGVAMLTPLPFSLYYSSGDLLPILISSGIMILSGGLSVLLVKLRKKDIGPKEGAAIVTFSWILLSAFGSLPYILSGAIPSFTDAFFETMSGFTTTGATILNDITVLPEGILFWRAMTHWIGGMGIIVLSIAILPFLGVGGMQLFKAEVPGPVADKLKPRITETAKTLWYVYVIISAAETILLMLGGLSLFDALCHTFATMATGGYSTHNESIAYFPPVIHYIIIVFMLFAGSNFALHYHLLKGNFKAYFRNHEFRAFLIIIFIATTFISIDVIMNTDAGISKGIRDSLFQVVSIITTTGFITADYELWSLSSQMLLFALMFVGGMAGSTGGGMKVMRIVLLIKFAYAELIRIIHPKAVILVRLGNQTIDRKILTNIAGYFVLVMLISSLSVIIMAFLGLDIATSFGIVAATVNNIGPGLGTVGAVDNYSHLSDTIKWILTFLMLLGRLEVFTVALLLVPAFWKK